MATVKTAYTADQTVELVVAYKAAPNKDTVDAFALKFGKTVKSVVAKLSREGVYKKAEYVGKTGEAPVKKDELADQFAALFGLTEAEADSMTKANKTALKKILAAVAVLKSDFDEAVETESDEENAGGSDFAEAVADVVGGAADAAGDMLTD